MSAVIRCDRCGKDISPHDKTVTGTVHVQVNRVVGDKYGSGKVSSVAHLHLQCWDECRKGDRPYTYVVSVK